MINWNQGDGFKTAPDPIYWDSQAKEWLPSPHWNDFWTIRGQSQWAVPMYAIFYIIGITLAVLFCAWRFYRKGLSITDLAIGVIFIIPCALFGGSFFGKLNAGSTYDSVTHKVIEWKNADGVGFWGLFAFWKPGMAIHGGVYVGSIVGLIVFGIIGHYRKVSLWTYMDAIIPNILLGQFVGRWGNFFNHEVMGAPIADVTNLVKGGIDTSRFVLHLPEYIMINTSVTYTGASGVQVGNLVLENGHIYEMAPIFFYESMSLLAGWFLIVFVIPNFGKWVGPKPWKKYSDLYKLNWRQTFLNIFAFWKVPTVGKINKMTQKFYEDGQVPSYSDQPAWAQSWFVIWMQAYEYNPNIKEVKEYEMEIDNIQNSNKGLTTKRYQMGKALIKANNPDGYWITKVGCEASAYYFVWNIVRFALELQRPDDHLFIMYEKTASLTLIAVTAFIGLLGMILTQTVIPVFFRQPGYLYEKDYFKNKKIDKHWSGRK